MGANTTRIGLATAAGAVALLLVGVGLSEGARPNGGTWRGKDVSFIVKKQTGRVVGFRAKYRVDWVCGNGDEPWTKLGNVTAKIRGGKFAKGKREWLGAIDRHLTWKVTGRFTGARRARGKIVWRLQGCGSFSSPWRATGPAAPRRGGGDGDGDSGPCIWIPLADGSGYICSRV